MVLHKSRFIHIGLTILAPFLLVLTGRAQSGVITTYVGPSAPVNGSQAMTQDIDEPTAVVPDGAGGFYIACLNDSRVFRVAANGTLSTIAGVGTTGFSGDGGPSTAAQLYYPYGVAMDPAGNLYIADWRNNRIRKVTVAGVISTLAGSGAQGFGGDGGPATTAQLNYPTSVVGDAAGNLYIADTGNYRIRKVTPAGIISTIAGNGTSGFSGDGGPATSAQLGSLPGGVAVDAAGNLYIADNQRIRKITPAGAISTVVGTGIAGFSGDGGPAAVAQLNSPRNVAADAIGTLYIADAGNYRIRKVTAAGVISTIAGTGTGGFSGDGGPATSSRLNSPSGVAVDAAGNVYIADTDNSRIRMITTSGVITTVAGNGTFSEMAVLLDPPSCLFRPEWRLMRPTIFILPTTLTTESAWSPRLG